MRKRNSSENTKKTSAEYDDLFNCRLIGDSRVGKSCLLLRYSKNIYDEGFIRSQDFEVKTINVEGKKLRIQAWDVNGRGQEDQDPEKIISSYYGRSNAVIVVFDLTDVESFNNVERWIKNLQKMEGGSAPIILVGTKSDAVSKRVVERQDVDEFLSRCRYNIEGYIETSSKTGKNVQAVFELAARAVLKTTRKELINENSPLLWQSLPKTSEQNIESSTESSKCYCAIL